VTLELGGKSPAYVDKSANLDVTVNRLLFGKFSNVGQTCVAPDYVLVDSAVKPALVDKLRETIKAWYGADASKSGDYSRIIHERHTRRLAAYLDEVRGHIVLGGGVDVPNRYVEPTLVVDPPRGARLLHEEIFGPILPILTVSGPDEAVQYIRSRYGEPRRTNGRWHPRPSAHRACVNSSRPSSLTAPSRWPCTSLRATSASCATSSRAPPRAASAST